MEAIENWEACFELFRGYKYLLSLSTDDIDLMVIFENITPTNDFHLLQYLYVYFATSFYRTLHAKVWKYLELSLIFMVCFESITKTRLAIDLIIVIDAPL